jgi:predicted nucleic acid-binding Zn ribbon protein
MKRRNASKINATMHQFWKDNPELYHKMLEARVIRLWSEVVGHTIDQYTTNIFIKNRVLNVSLSSSVARGEILSMRKRIVELLNQKAASDVIDDLFVR